MIRRMTEDDIISIGHIESKSFTDPWSNNAFMDSLENPSSVYLICEEEGIIKGYICIYIAADEGEIVKAAVSREARRRGVGSRIMKAAFAYGREKGITKYYLEVRKSNTGAVDFYKSLGFTDIGIRRNFYERPVEDAVIMVKGVN